MPGKDKISVKRSLWIRAFSRREKWEDKVGFYLVPICSIMLQLSDA